MPRMSHVLAAATMAALLTPAAALAGPAGSTVLQSRPSGLAALPAGPVNTSTLNRYGGPTVSADGCRTVFSSVADGLMDGDPDAQGNLYLRDVCGPGSGTIALVTRDHNGTAVGGTHNNATLSPNGRYVAFFSFAKLTADADTGGWVYRRDMSAGTTVAIARTGGAGQIDAGYVADDGTVAFRSSVPHDTTNDSGTSPDVYAGTGGAPRLVSAKPDGSAAGGVTQGLSISGDGTKVAYATTTAVLAADANGTGDAYVVDLATSTTTLASRATGPNGAAAGTTEQPALNHDGSVVAFATSAGLDASDSGGQDVYRRKGDTTILVSRRDGATGTNLGGIASSPTLDQSGERIAFQSNGTIGDADQNGTVDVYVRDVAANQTRLLSRDGFDGAVGNAHSESASISKNGQYVVFTTWSTNLPPAIANDFQRVIRKGLNNSDHLVVSTPATDVGGFDDGTNAAESAFKADAVSGNGRYTVFVSRADRISDADHDRWANLFRRDNKTGQTRLVFSAPASVTGNAGHVSRAAISDDGNRIAFVTGAQIDPVNDANGLADVYLHDVKAGTTVLVSRPTGTSSKSSQGGGDEIALSGDGRRVAFLTGAQLDAAKDVNAQNDVYVRDVAAGTTVLGSADPDGRATGSGGMFMTASLDFDGSHVAWETGVPTVPGEPGGWQDVYVRELATGTVELASRADGADGEFGTGMSRYPSLNADGTRVAFETWAANLGDGDTSATSSVYVRDVEDDRTILVSRGGTGDANANGPAEMPSISADGTKVAFQASASSLGEANLQAWLRDLDAQTTVAVSRSDGPAGITRPGAARPSVSADGRCVAFFSRAALGADHAGGDFEQLWLRAAGGDCPSVAAPDTVIDSGPEGLTDDATPTFTFHGEGAPASYACTLDGVPIVSCASPLTLSELEEAEHVLTVAAVDEDGLADPTPAERRFRVDLAAPDTTIDAGPTGTTTDATPQFAFSSDDADATFECGVDGAWQPCTSPTVTSALADGQHTFAVRATDVAGRVDPTPATRTFTVDAVPDTPKTEDEPTPQPPAGGGAPPASGTAPSTAPPAPAQPRGTTAPAATVKLATRSAKLDRKGRAKLTLRCTGAPCRGTLVLRAKAGRRTVVLARGTYAIAAGKAGKVTVKVGRKALKGKRSLKVTADLGGGQRVSLTLRG